MRDIKSRLGLVQLLEPQDAVTTDVASGVLDTWGFNGAMLAVLVGTITGVGATAYLTPVLEHSDTLVGEDFEAVDAAEISGAFTKIDATNEDQLVQSVGYTGSKRYLRVNLDFTGTVTATLVAVLGIVGRPRVLPAVAPAVKAAT